MCVLFYAHLQDGNTPLHITASRGDTEVVSIILSHIQRNGPVDVINYRNNVSQPAACMVKCYHNNAVKVHSLAKLMTFCWVLL